LVSVNPEPRNGPRWHPRSGTGWARSDRGEARRDAGCW